MPCQVVLSIPVEADFVRRRLSQFPFVDQGACALTRAAANFNAPSLIAHSVFAAHLPCQGRLFLIGRDRAAANQTEPQFLPVVMAEHVFIV